MAIPEYQYDTRPRKYLYMMESMIYHILRPSNRNPRRPPPHWIYQSKDSPEQQNIIAMDRRVEESKYNVYLGTIDEQPDGWDEFNSILFDSSFHEYRGDSQVIKVLYDKMRDNYNQHNHYKLWQFGDIKEKGRSSKYQHLHTASLIAIPLGDDDVAHSIGRGMMYAFEMASLDYFPFSEPTAALKKKGESSITAIRNMAFQASALTMAFHKNEHPSGQSHAHIWRSASSVVGIGLASHELYMALMDPANDDARNSWARQYPTGKIVSNFCKPDGTFVPIGVDRYTHDIEYPKYFLPKFPFLTWRKDPPFELGHHIGSGGNSWDNI